MKRLDSPAVIKIAPLLVERFLQADGGGKRNLTAISSGIEGEALRLIESGAAHVVVNPLAQPAGRQTDVTVFVNASYQLNFSLATTALQKALASVDTFSV